MTPRFSGHAEEKTQKNGKERPSSDAPLGWEGYVHVPNGTPFWIRILRGWPELRYGLAFSVIFISGAIVGGSLATMMFCNRQRPEQ